jgi:hypothetical protein
MSELNFKIENDNGINSLIQENGEKREASAQEVALWEALQDTEVDGKEAAAFFTDCFAKLLNQPDVKNYVEFGFNHPVAGLMSVTVKKPNGKTPSQVATEYREALKLFEQYFYCGENTQTKADLKELRFNQFVEMTKNLLGKDSLGNDTHSAPPGVDVKSLLEDAAKRSRTNDGAKAFHNDGFTAKTLRFLVEQGLSDQGIHEYLELLGSGIQSEDDTYYQTLAVIRADVRAAKEMATK